MKSRIDQELHVVYPIDPESGYVIAEILYGCVQLVTLIYRRTFNDIECEIEPHVQPVIGIPVADFQRILIIAQERLYYLNRK